MTMKTDVHLCNDVRTGGGPYGGRGPASRRQRWSWHQRGYGARNLVNCLLSVSVLLSFGCAVDPDYREKRREELAIWKAEFADANRACRRRAGHIVQYPPEVGGAYRCVR